MSKTSSANPQVLKEINIKWFVVIVCILIDLGLNWYIAGNTLPVKEMCLKEYPELAEVLDHAVYMPEGYVMAEDGRMFPPGAWWAAGGVVHGCPCSGHKPCVRKCCAKDQSFNTDDAGYRCVDKQASYQFTDMLNINSNHFSVLSSGCSLGYSANLTRTFEDLHILEDGTVVNQNYDNSWDQLKYCLEVMEDSNFTTKEVIFVNCDEILPEDKRRNDLEYQTHIYTFYFINVLSIVVNCMIILAYAVLPMLQRSYGKFIMCYMGSLIFSTTEFLLMDYVPENFCIPYGVLELWFSLSTRTWQILISYQIWILLRPGAVSSRGTEHPRSKEMFPIYCIFGWGIPFICTSITLIVELTPGVPDYLKPHFKHPFCEYGNSNAQMIYSIAPTMIGEISNMLLCLATLLSLRASQKNSEALQSSNRSQHSKHIHWSKVYVKVCLAMGIIYVFVTGIAIFDFISTMPAFVMQTLQDIYYMRGVEVMLVFIFKKEILADIFLRLGFKKKTSQNE